MADVLYIAASVNRHPHAASASTSSEILFGSNKFIACWDSAADDDCGVRKTLPGHEAEVTAVKWINDSSFCSGDQKGVLLVWNREAQANWKVTHRIEAHARGISALATYGDLIVTGSSEGSIKVHRLGNQTLEQIQVIDNKNRYPLAIGIAKLPGSQALIMAVASTDRNIRIFTRSTDQFISSLSLEGHEDWVKCLAFSASSPDLASLGSITLASGSQDGYIRLWLIAPTTASSSGIVHGASDQVDELMDAFEKSLGEVDEDVEEGGKKISNRIHVFAVNDSGGTKQYSLTFDALLVGHEAGVTSLAWRPQPLNEASSTSSSPPTLLSTSTDSSIILWSPTDVPIGPSTQGTTGATATTTSLWMNRQRFGDVGGVKPGGFVAGLWAREGKDVLGCGWNGGWRRWRDTSPNEKKASTSASENWVEIPAVLGHFGPVKGIAWDAKGDYLISTSLDQTTRIHGAWRRPSSSTSSTPSTLIETWHEIARPQIHGYDIVDSSFVGSNSLQFVSTADEKVARVFDAPKGFVRTLKGLNVKSKAQSHSGASSEELGEGQGEVDEMDEVSRPAAAVVPPLGLSNKATVDGSSDLPITSQDDAGRHTRPPLEPELGALTLWPESEKVFGHGYELFALAISHSGGILATSCKATTAEHAVIRLYDTKTWRSLGEPLTGHVLTITRIAFSPDDQMILSVSRDRTWRLFKRDSAGGEDGVVFRPAVSDKSHARVIWDCAWAKEGDVFATAGRDKLVKVWKSATSDGSKWVAIQTIKMKEAATAVDFLPSDDRGIRRLAVGTEVGSIHIFQSPLNSPEGFNEIFIVDPMMSHVDQVQRLAWRPSASAKIDASADLATCSEDRSIRILRIPFHLNDNEQRV